MKTEFAHVDTWVFDLDHTLYPPTDRLFDQIEDRMRSFIMDMLDVPLEQADALRDLYWREHGTTLAGLMAEHGMPPEPFMSKVHDVDTAHMRPAPDLAQAIKALPGRRIVYTNGSRPYAQRVIEARGLTGAFDEIYGIEHAHFVPKPHAAAFDAVFALAGIRPANAAMFEDTLENLQVPHRLGMRTIHVGPPGPALDHVHHSTNDLAGFLSQVV